MQVIQKGVKAVVYTRVSTAGQAEEGVSLATQEERARSWALANGYAVAGVYADAGVSGAARIDKRPALLDALAVLARGDVLLVAKRDRIGRDPIAVAMIERMAERKGARVMSAAGEGTESDDPSAVLMRRVVDAFAEYERLVIGARTRQALAHKRARGERVGEIPYGYRLAADGIHLEEDRREQRAMQIMAELRRRGMTWRQIAEELNARGVCSRSPRGWSWQTTRRLSLAH